MPTVTFTVDGTTHHIPPIDNELIRQAQNCADGSNIHRVNEHIHLYITSMDCLKRIAEKKLKGGLFLLRSLAVANHHEAELRKLIQKRKREADASLYHSIQAVA